jgi:hypothetical protein
MEHRDITNFCQPTLFFVICLASFQDTFCSCSSIKIVLFQVILDLPFLLSPCGFQSSPCLVLLFWSFLKVCPISFHFLIFISLSICICYVVSHRSLFVMVFGHHILSMLRRHWLTNVCNLLIICCVIFHVSHPYSSTLITWKYNRSVLLLVGELQKFTHENADRLYEFCERNTFCNVQTTEIAHSYSKWLRFHIAVMNSYLSLCSVHDSALLLWALQTSTCLEMDIEWQCSVRKLVACWYSSVSIPFLQNRVLLV